MCTGSRSRARARRLKTCSRTRRGSPSPRELPLDRGQDGRHGDGELGMVVGEREERAPAAQPQLEAGRAEGLHEAVPRQGRGARLQDEGKPPAHDFRRRRDRAARPRAGRRRGARSDERGHHRTEDVGPRQQGDERADQQRIARQGRRGRRECARSRRIAGRRWPRPRDRRAGFGRRGRSALAGLGQGAEHRRAGRTRQALHGREVGERVLRRRAWRSSLWRRSPPSRAPT